MRFRGFLTAGGFYGDGLTPPATDNAGATLDQTTYGYLFGYGVYGNRQGRRDAVSLNYTGSYTLYSSSHSRYSGLNQRLSLNYSRQLTSRWQFFVGAGGYARNTALPVDARTAPVDSLEIFQPQDELFDNQHFSVSSHAGVSYRKSARWTFTMLGGAGTTRRHSRFLSSGTVYTASGESSYALSRRTSVGASYTYTRISYLRSFGGSDIMSVQGHWSHALSPRWTTSLSGGIFRSESSRLGVVPVDPFITALTGQRQALAVFHGISRGVVLSGGLTGVYGKSHISLAYNRSVSPGNSLLLTSQQDYGMAGYTYAATRKLSLGANGHYNKLKGLLESYRSLRNFEVYGAGGSLNYHLLGPMHLNASATSYHYNQEGINLARGRYQVMIGLSFTSGDLPLLLW